MAFLKPCTRCGKLSPKSRCPEHEYKKPPPAKRGLGWSWRKIAEAWVREFPYCMCRAPGCHDRDGLPCQEKIGADNPLTCDHIVPRVAGGTDERSNLATLCRRCNSRKGARQLAS